MKKLLGVSIAAMLAVSPMLASAAVTATSSQIAAANTDVTSSNNVATTSYVKGAYKAMATEVNKVQTDVANVISDINVAEANEVTGGVVTHSNSVAQNLVALDNAVKNAASTASTTYQLQQDSNVVAGANETLHHLTAGTGVATNLKALDAQVYANETAIGTNTSNISGLTTRMGTAEGNISTLTTAVGDANSGLTKGVADNTSAISGLGSRLTTAEGDIDALETAVGNINTASANYATKLGVVATINNSTASGTVRVYNDWTDETNGYADVTVSSTVTAPATNAYYGTLAAQSGTTQTDPQP